MHPWREIGDGAWIRRYPFLDQTIGAIVGTERVLVVDSRSTLVQARELLGDLRHLTGLPHVVVNTHAHFDHVFGNRAFRPCEIWSHERCAAALRERGEIQRENVARWVPDLADEIRATPIDPPDRTFADDVEVDLGDRAVHLRHLGRGHTDHDAVIVDAHAGIVFAGDLVEQGAPPGFDDSFPLDWPATLGQLLDLVKGPVVPGHGEPLTFDEVAAQLAEISFLAEIARRSAPPRSDGGARATPGPTVVPQADLVRDAARHLGWPEEPVATALARAFAQVNGSA